MLQSHTTLRLDQIEFTLRRAAERHGASVLAVSRVGADALTFSLCFQEVYAALLRAEVRLAAFLPARVAACARGEGAVLEAVSPRDFIRLLHRPELEPLAEAFEHDLRAVMEEAARHQPASAEHLSTEEQVNMRASVPQRIDCHGTKVEELGGTGVHDAQGG